MSAVAPGLVAGAVALALVSNPLLAGAARRLRVEPQPSTAASGGATSVSSRAPSLVLAAAVAIAGWVAPTVAAFVALVVGASLLLVVSMVDLAEERIPNRLTIPAGAACVGIILATFWIPSLVDARSSALVGAAVFSAVLLVLHLARPDAMGLGDVKLAFPLGFAIGWVVGDAAMAPAAVGLTLVVASIMGLSLVYARHLRSGERKRSLRRQAVPFGPALSLAGATTIALALGLG